MWRGWWIFLFLSLPILLRVLCTTECSLDLLLDVWIPFCLIITWQDIKLCCLICQLNLCSFSYLGLLSWIQYPAEPEMLQRCRCDPEAQCDVTWFLLVIFYGKIEVFSSLTVENRSKLKINRNFLLVRSCIGFISGKDANFSLVVKMQTFLLLSLSCGSLVFLLRNSLFLHQFLLCFSSFLIHSFMFQDRQLM